MNGTKAVKGKEKEKEKYLWRVDCSVYGVFETVAVSAAQAANNCAFRLKREMGRWPDRTYWDAPKMIG